MTNLIKPALNGASHKPERNDCTVRALANAASIDYVTAHKLLWKHGRENKCGAQTTTSHAAYIEAGLTLKSIHGKTIRARLLARKAPGMAVSKGITLGSLLPSLGTGSYVVMVTGHALAVVNGEVIDTFASRAGKEVFGLYQAQ